MPAESTLAVWLHGIQVAELTQLRNGRLRLWWTPEAITRWGEGSCPLSLSLPITVRRVQGPHLKRYFDGLLPESPLRGQLEREHRLAPDDAFGLLRALGAECAGAVQVLPPGTEPSSGTLRVLSDAEADGIVSDLPTLPLADDLPMTASLGGIQAKVLLTATPDGWAWPLDGAPSTHIVKPEPLSDAVIPDLVRLEDWTMRLARAAGIDAAATEVREFGGRTAIVVERYDRVDGERIHQEDLAQGLGLATRDKYEQARSPGHLTELAERAHEHAADPDGFLDTLLEQVTFNVVVGNGDSHAKNYSYVIDAEARVRPAPLYDAAAVQLVVPRYDRSGLAVNGKTRLQYIGPTDLAAESVAWGRSAERSRKLVDDVVERIREAARDVEDDPCDVREKLLERAAGFGRA
ncbi:type II toxin-antitoxin system HipA family toxin [Promicromonospora sp. NPDC060204]|uniref:type II toxin-antitoxin system HipA family toxin n=1 Tax=Promicromonospora sp. NPDC060204 TaxID=3347071 RepID=UPI003655D395